MENERKLPALLVDPAAEGFPHSRRWRRGRTTWRGNLLRIGFLSVATVAVIGAWLFFAGGFSGWRSRPDRPAPLPEPVARVPAPISPAPISPVSAPPGEPDQSARLLAALQDRVVKIEADQPGGTAGLGSGFVVGAEGLVATSFHVIGEATRARVSFQNGAAYEVAGYAAVDPALDLAVLKLVAPPESLAAMTLRSDGDPPQLSPVVAVGHPHGVEFSTFDGTVSKVLDTDQLPSHSREFLSRLIAGEVNHRWVVHSARIAEGNSGGPLVNDAGEVIGVNTWVDRQTGTGYALHARFLAEMLRERMLPEIAPLEKFARRDARVATLLARLSPGRVQQLFEDAQAMKWRPADDDDYEKLGQLAWAITFASLPSALHDPAAGNGGLNEPQLRELTAVTDRIVGRLKVEKWNGPGQITLINELAAGHLRSPRAGLFFFADVERIVSGDDGSRAAILRLSGLDQPLFLPLEGQLADPQPGSCCLVLGVNYDGHTVRYGDNPLRPIIAPVILSRTIVPLAP